MSAFLNRATVRGAAVLLLVLAATAVPAQADVHVGQSVNVGVISDPSSVNGGEFPTTTSGPTGAFTDFNFTNVPVASVDATTLAGFDTVLLNVGSTEINCDLTVLSATQKTDLVNFLNGGGKLIISDSECPPQDYSWLPFPFTTANPGALGGVGTINIVENNFLGSNNSADTHFIDGPALGSGTDAVGDMNVLTTTDPNLCLHMSGTNEAGQTGPTHVYFKAGTGLGIYNGFDIDAIGTTTAPDASDPVGNPEGNLAKIWLQELQQPLNGQNLPCTVLVFKPPAPPAMPLAANPPPLVCKGAAATRSGTTADDFLRGSPMRDVIVGLEGRDRIRAGRGDDLICAGPGNDVARGSFNKDLILGQPGTDKLVGGPGIDTVVGGGGNDRIRGGDDSDTLRAGSGDDTVRSRGNVSDKVNCGSGDDTAIADRFDVVAGNCETVLLP